MFGKVTIPRIVGGTWSSVRYYYCHFAEEEEFLLAQQLTWHQLPVSPVLFAPVSDCLTG